MQLNEMEKAIVCEELKLSICRYQKLAEKIEKGSNEEILLNFYQKQIKKIEEIIKKL